MENLLTTQIFDLTLSTPLTNVAGIGQFGYQPTYNSQLNEEDLSIITLKAISYEPMCGNPEPRIIKTKHGWINAIGSENGGLKHFLTNTLPKIKALNKPVIININGKSVEEYVKLAAAIDQLTIPKIVELNLSCPNVTIGSIHFGTNLMMVKTIVKAVRQVLKQTKLLVKLSPIIGHSALFAQACEAAGADGLSLINSFPAMEIDLIKQKPKLGFGTGGLSGPALTPIALKMVYDAYQVVKIPIIAMGGISCVADALAFLMAGASLLAIGSATFENPQLIAEIKTGLTTYCQTQKLANINAIVGIAHHE